MRALVTGGAGFIGSHIVDKLISMNYEVIVIDNQSSTVHEQFYFNSSPKAVYYNHDITNYESIRHLFDGVSVVFHLAAESRIQPSIDNPLLALKTNSYGTAVILQCAREASVKKVIYSSTSSAYGLLNQVPYREDMPNDCLNTYSVSKVAGEEYCKNYTKLYGLKTVILRYFNVYGPREPLKGPYAPVIGLFLRKYKNDEPLTIVGDGHQRRDFTHIEDVVNANMAAMTSDFITSETFNVGTGVNYSILEIVNMIPNRGLTSLPPRPGESRETLADISKTQRVLGWQPTKSIVDYIQENL
jgi:UDP-glucose 4-epimerase